MTTKHQLRLQLSNAEQSAAMDRRYAERAEEALRHLRDARFNDLPKDHIRVDIARVEVTQMYLRAPQFLEVKFEGMSNTHVTTGQYYLVRITGEA